MVSKTSTDGRPYEIDATKKVAHLVWHPEDDDGETGNIPEVRIPLRLKLGSLMDIGLDRELDMPFMVEIIEGIVPASHMATVRLMDVNDFQDMFATWQTEYNAITGGSLGESSPSPASPSPTEQPSSTTSEPVSV